jgi:autotransporter-associated beta strand protein
VADAIAIGSGSLTKTGSGSLTLGATNTYSGKTTIANGTISVGSIDALGTNAALDLGVATTSSGRLLYTGGVTTLTKDINALGNGTDTIQNEGSGLLTLSGTLTKAGTTLNLVGGASGILVTGTIVGLPASSDLVIGNGTTTLQNANTYNGPTILNSGGTLNINHASAISTGAFTINGGTINNTSGADITLSTNNPLNINANFTFTGTNSLNLGTGAVTLDANRTVTVTANTLTIGGAIGGAFSLTGTGAGTLLLTGASTYTGTTTAVTGSTISVGGNGSLGDTSSGTVIDSGASLALNNVLYTDAEPLNINGAGVGSGGAFITTGTSSFAGTITATTNATINATGTLSLTGGLVKNGTTLTLGGTGTYNISGAGISGSSANSDLVVDSSTVNLDVASTYNGPTFIRNGGRINANVASALPTSTARTAVIMDDSGPGSSTLGLAVNQSVASLTGAATSQILLGASELTVGASGSGSSVFAGSIAGTGGSIVKDGANTQTFSGANTFDAGTTVNGGTLLVNNTTGSGTGSGAVSVSNAGTVIGGNGTVAGNLTVNAGALIAPGSAANTAGTLTIGGSTVVIAGNGVAETRVNFDYTNATGNVPGLTASTWSSYSGALLTGNGGQSNDLLNFTATTTSLSWNTGGKINLNQIGSAYSWIQGDVFNLLDWSTLSGGAISGSFDSAVDFNLPSLSGGLAWDTTRFVTTGAIAVVPEPSRALLMLFGLMALFFRRRRQD